MSKKIITGTHKKNGTWEMHAPEFPYWPKVIFPVGVTETEMKKAYRKMFGLKHKHIEWVIL